MPTSIKLWVLRSIDMGTTFETVDTSRNPPNIEMLFDETGILRNTIYRPALFAVPPGQFHVLTEIGEPWDHVQSKDPSQ